MGNKAKRKRRWNKARKRMEKQRLNQAWMNIFKQAGVLNEQESSHTKGA